MMIMQDIWNNLPNIGGLFTSIGIFLGAVVAVPKYIDYLNIEERNSADKRFLELSSRASSSNIQEMVIQSHHCQFFHTAKTLIGFI